MTYEANKIKYLTYGDDNTPVEYFVDTKNENNKGYVKAFVNGKFEDWGNRSFTKIIENGQEISKVEFEKLTKSK